MEPMFTPEEIDRLTPEQKAYLRQECARIGKECERVLAEQKAREEAFNRKQAIQLLERGKPLTPEERDFVEEALKKVIKITVRGE